MCHGNGPRNGKHTHTQELLNESTGNPWERGCSQGKACCGSHHSCCACHEGTTVFSVIHSQVLPGPSLHSPPTPRSERRSRINPTILSRVPWKGMDIRICITDLLCCTPEINIFVNQLYSNKIYFKKLIPSAHAVWSSHSQGLQSLAALENNPLSSFCGRPWDHFVGEVCGLKCLTLGLLQQCLFTIAESSIIF